jgi:hypothetical protein
MSRVAGFASGFAFSGFAVGTNSGIVTVVDVVVTECTVSDVGVDG